MKRVAAALIILVTAWVVVPMIQTVASAPSLPQRFQCPTLESRARFGDVRDLCATAANAVATSRDGRMRPTVSALNCGIPPASAVVTIPTWENETGVAISEEVSSDVLLPCDTFTSTSVSGGPVTTNYYNPGTTYGNYPGESGYDSSLPVGILVSPSGAPARSGAASRSAAAQGEPSTAGLTYYHTKNLEIESEGGCPNNSQVCSTSTWYFYRVKTNRESDPNNNYVIILGRIRGHGGNSSHYLDLLANQTRVVNYADGVRMIDYAPDSTTTVPEGTETKQVTVNFAPSLGGYSLGGVSVTDTVTIRRTKMGPITDGLPRFFYGGWVGPGMGCENDGTGVCDYSAARTVVAIKYPVSEPYKVRVQMRACWHDWIFNDTCLWGSQP